MSTLIDLYSFTVQEPLSIADYHFGSTTIVYRVTQVNNVRNLKHKRSYRIDCTQRIVIPNQTVFNPAPNSTNYYNEYPAVIVNQIVPGSIKSGVMPHLANYSPRTMNSSVTTSLNVSDGTTSSTSRQHTSGSSTSQTNTYGGSVQFGFSGEDLTGGVSADYSHSSTHESNTSNTTGTDSGTSTDRGTGDSISIKDWGAYALIDVENTSPTWVWGQEYPWDVIQYRYCPVNNNVDLPDFVSNLLFYTDTSGGQQFAMPPSHLSMFGVDFVMKASWLIELPKDLAEQTISFSHLLQYQTASHGYQTQNNAQVQVASLSPAGGQSKIASPPLDLTLLGLDPITNSTASNGAVIGFVPNKFVVAPDKGAAFKIISGTNNLQVTGAGFNSVMWTDFTNGPVNLVIQFKIVEDINNYSLYMKHWKTTANGCTLSIVINGDDLGTITNHVDAKEGEGGENNLLSLELRNKDYSSIDYHDYLVFGLNSIVITITQDDASQPCGYALRAIAIGDG